MALLKISGGKVYDPANGVNGEVRDLWVRDGMIVAHPFIDEMHSAHNLASLEKFASRLSKVS